MIQQLPGYGGEVVLQRADLSWYAMCWSFEMQQTLWITQKDEMWIFTTWLVCINFGIKKIEKDKNTQFQQAYKTHQIGALTTQLKFLIVFVEVDSEYWPR